jgi:hypothetical protein
MGSGMKRFKVRSRYADRYGARHGMAPVFNCGHPLLYVESFVDESQFEGTAYRAAGWRRLGSTAGFARVAGDFYVAHDRPKQLYVMSSRSKPK